MNIVISLYKGPSITTSNEYSEYTTKLLCSDPNSSAAKSFQECNFFQIGLIKQI